MTNAAIITFFMTNIDMKSVDLQRKVVEKFNKEKYPHYSIQTSLRHGYSIDLAWALNGVKNKTFEGHPVDQRFDHDVLLFLDVDAVPLNDNAIDCLVTWAKLGELTGNIQRSNHIENNQHLFVAPSVLALSRDTYKLLDCPSAIETKSGDVAEEYTYEAESRNIRVSYYFPLKVDEKPQDGKMWQLKPPFPPYGRGTTFGVQYNPDSSLMEKPKEMFWHQFQSMHEGQKEKFWAKCNGLLK